MNILTPTDFSDNSLKAIKYSIRIAKKLSASITVVYVFEVRQEGGYLKSMDQVLEEDANREMNKFRKKIEDDLGYTNLTYKVLRGDPVSTISKMADDPDYDLVIMGTKGASGLKKVFLGSIAGGVISKTKGPVLVVPEDAEIKPPELIVFGVTEIPLSSSKVLEPLKKLVKAFNSEITLLHIADDRSESLKELLEEIKDLNYSVVYEFGNGNINQRINEYMEKSDAHMLCLIRRKQGLFDRIFGGSVTLKQTFQSQKPLLILHN